MEQNILNEPYQQKSGFEQKYWPVCISLLVLGGMLVGDAIFFLRFDDPRIIWNAWTYVISLPIFFAFVLWAFYKIRNHYAYRGTQVSLILSLIFHLILIVASSNIYWVQQQRISSEDLLQMQDEPIPDYQQWQIDPENTQIPDILKPIAAEIPETILEQVKKTEEEPLKPEVYQHLQTDPEVEKKFIEPHEIQRRQVAESVPRRSQELSQLSRQLNQTKPHSDNAPEVFNARQSTPEHQATSASIRRRETQANLKQSDSSANTPLGSTTPSSQIARRRQSQEAQLSSQPVPRLRRQKSSFERRTTQAEKVSVSEPIEVPVADSREIAATRQQAKIRNRNSVLDDMPITSPETISQNTVRRQAENYQPQVTQNKNNIAYLSQSQNRPNIENINSRVPVEITSNQPSPRRPLSPQETTLTRESNSYSNLQTNDLVQIKTQSPSPQQATVVNVTRAQEASVPTIQANSSSVGTPRRTAQESPFVMSPVAVSSPALAEADSLENKQGTQPTQIAITRSTEGIIGQGQSPNMDRQLPAPESTMHIASAAANRPSATRRQEQGPAVTPRERVEFSRSRVGEKTPAAYVVAQQLDNATTRGKQRTSERETTSSAAVSRSAALATLREASADKGTQTLDQGAMQIVSNLGSGRASGGGRPQLNLDSRNRQFARSSGAVAQISVAVDVQDPSPQAPNGEAGGQPVSESQNALATSTKRSRTGGKVIRANIRAPEIESKSSSGIISSQLVRRSLESSNPAFGKTENSDNSSLTKQGRLPKRAGSIAGVDTSVVIEPAQSEGTAGRESVAPLELRIQRTAGSLPMSIETLETRKSESGDTGENYGSVRLATAIERNKRKGSDNGPTLESDIPRRGKFPKKASIEEISGTVAKIEIEENSEDGAQARNSREKLDLERQSAELGRTTAAELAVEIVAHAGPGGLGREPALNVGRMNRRAQLQSEEIHEQKARFLRKNTGGPPAVQATVAIPTKAFAGRKRRAMNQVEDGQGQPPPKTEEAIEAGLRFLAVCQLPDGSWSLSKLGVDSLNRQERKPSLQADTSATGLALLSFLGAGYQHIDDKYKGVVRAGIDYLIHNQQESGELFVKQDDQSSLSVRLYSHGIAAIALCEAYGMTQDPKLQKPAQKAIDFIVNSQHAQRGGWRYRPGQGSDTSVTGWLMMALKSGELASLVVPDESFQKIEHWLDLAQVSKTKRHLYRYNPYAEDTATQRHGRLPNRTMTSVGLLMRLYTGWRRENSDLARGGDYLLEHLPEIGTTRRPQRDSYYWYYATQVMFHLGDKYWSQWNARLHPLLVESQLKESVLAGSWDPHYPIPDRWGPHAGRLYVTTLNLLSLEVYYRHLPIYEDTAR